jgi:alpha-amylase
VPIAEVRLHYQKLGQFRRAHPSVGAGLHKMISESPYIFSRTYESNVYSDRVVAGLELDPGKKQIDLNGLFEEGTVLRDYYSGERVAVKGDRVTVDSPFNIVLLGL